VRVRYSRGADFSGTCIYTGRRVFINLGRHVRYPYELRTNLARARMRGRCWRREVFVLDIADAYQLALFIFLHELYHLLVKRAGRNTRQKESRCDRFAARTLVDRFGAKVFTSSGQSAPREEWDFQDLEGFVARARLKPRGNAAKTRAPQTRTRESGPLVAAAGACQQLLLFPIQSLHFGRQT